nr:MAG TPA: hypothetical protein [Caudoviricetes sp.]
MTLPRWSAPCRYYDNAAGLLPRRCIFRKD